MAYCGKIPAIVVSNVNGSSSFQPPTLFDPVVQRPSACFDDLVQLVERVFHVAAHRDVGDLVLVDLRRVDVDVDDLAVLGELARPCRSRGRRTARPSASSRSASLTA